MRPQTGAAMSLASRKLAAVWPFWASLQGYNTSKALSDVSAAFIVTLLLIPQSLAYALLAGLPPQLGLYASIWPLVFYALFGSSRQLSVGPVAVLSLLTASAIGPVVKAQLASPLEAAVALSLLSGGFLGVMALLRLGFLARLLSHGVIAGFTLGSALLIILTQLYPLFGLSPQGVTVWQLLAPWLGPWPKVQGFALSVGLGCLGFFVVTRLLAAKWLRPMGRGSVERWILRLAPLVLLLTVWALSYQFNGPLRGLATLGPVASGLPAWHWPQLTPALIEALWLPALSIALIGYVESLSMGLALAARARQTLHPNRELWGLGAANLASAFSGSFPVTGGVSRSVVNAEAGAETQLASLLTAALIFLAAAYLTDALPFLPKAVLAATTIMAVWGLLDLSIFRKTWRFSPVDFGSLSVTLIATLLLGVEVGVLAGIASSLMLILYQSSRPHLAELGRLPGSAHFRNRLRHSVELNPALYLLRIDESLFFGNITAVTEAVSRAIAERHALKDVVLVFNAVNHVDYTALHQLSLLEQSLASAAVRLHLAEVKGPVMDALIRADFFAHFSGSVFASTAEAVAALEAKTTPVHT
jgi:sulfate permease, SulP family